MKQGKRDIIITTDSLCDLSQEALDEYGIAVNPYRINTPDGSFLDGTELDTKGLLVYIKNPANSAKSFAPTVDNYIAFFKEQRKSADIVIHIMASDFMSSGYQRAVEAAETVGNVYIFNSNQLSGGIGLVAIKASELARSGRSPQQIMENLEIYVKYVHMSVVISDTAYQVNLGKMFSGVSALMKRFQSSMVMNLKDGGLKNSGIVSGNKMEQIRSYVRKMLVNSWAVDNEVCIVTYTNMSEEEVSFFKSEINKYVKFQKIYVCETSAANACLTGENCFGIMFARHGREQLKDETAEDNSFVNRAVKFFKRHLGFLVRDEYSVQHKLLNMILAVWILGGIVTAIATLAIGSSVTVCIGTLAMALGLSVAMYLSTVKDNYFAASVIILIFVNVIVFPVLYFASGGIRSGMLAWIVLGLIVAWMLFDGATAVIFYIINVCVMIATLYVSVKLPGLVEQVTDKYIYLDWVQSAIIVSTAIGAIFKFQNYAYEKQNLKLRQHQEELIRATHAKSTFLANMSHEIRTPINGIMGMNSMLLKECGDNEVLKEYATNIHSASNALLSIVNDILDISKIESGKLELVQEEYDVFGVLNDCYNMTQSRAREKGLEFSISVDPMIPARLFGDEVRVRQVINNFLSNAVKYTPSGNVSLNVGCRKLSDAKTVLIVSVKDSGIGIKKENIDELFSAFSRFDEKKNKNIEGTGLGLNLTANLVQMMGGEIFVDSIYNQGSTFTAEIPQGVRSREYMGEFEENYKKLLAQNVVVDGNIYAPDAKILIVDDVPMNLLVAKGLLKYTEIQVDTAGGGMDALGMLMKKQYDLVLLDHMMPEIDGIETFRRLKEIPDCVNMNTPVVMLTANAVFGAKEEYLKAGFADYLTKPIVEKDLMELLTRILPPELLRRKEKDEDAAVAAIRKVAGIPEIRRPMQQQTEEANKVIMINEINPVEAALDIPPVPVMKVKAKIDPAVDPIHTDAAMRYCMGSMNFYNEIAKAYVNEAQMDQLSWAYSNNDAEAYCAVVHAIRNASLVIGATDLSEHAKRIETAIKAGNTIVISAEHDALIKEYENVISWVKKKYI